MTKNYMKIKGRVNHFDDLTQLSVAVEQLDVAEIRNIASTNPDGTYETEKMKRWRTVWNITSNTPENIVSDDYTLLLHRQAFKQVISAVSPMNTPISGNLISSKGRAYLEVKFNDVFVEVAGDKVQLQLLFCNSYNTSKAFRGMAGGFRVVCSNGMIVGKAICEDMYSKHYGKTPESMVDEVKSFIKLAISSHEKLAVLMSEAMADTVEMKLAERLLNAFMSIEKHKVVLRQKLKEIGRNPTRWDLYNLITDYLTHNLEAKYEYVLQMQEKFANKFLTESSTNLERQALVIEATRIKETEA